MIRAGIVGAGYIGQAHARGYAALPPSRARLAGVYDRHQDRAEKLAAAYGARAVTSLAALLEMGINVVSICTGTPSHASLALTAMAAGVHVLCEKPLARTAAEAAQMIEAARRGGLKLMPGHNSRFEAEHAKAKEIVDRGDLGRLRMGFQSISSAFPDWSLGWYADAAQSGGPVLDLAIHSVDYLQWVFGCRVVRVCATGWQEEGLFRYASITLRLEDGGIGLVETSWAHPRSQPLQLRTELAGTQGRLAWDYEQIAAMRVVAETTGCRDLILPGEDSYAAEVAAFVACVEHNTPSPIPPEAGLEALRVCLAASESLETGKAVTITR